MDSVKRKISIPKIGFIKEKDQFSIEIKEN